MLNNLPVKNQARQPKTVMLINGQLVYATTISVEEKTFYESDTFTIDLPIHGQPAGIDLQYFDSTSAMLLEVYTGFPSNPANFSTADLTNIFTGQVDDVDIDLTTQSINLIGRDLTAKFIDNKTTEKFQNLTPSQIAEILAKRRGLNYVITPTDTKASYFYGINYTKMTSLQTEWDLLTFLAQQLDFACYVKGQTLYFKPAPTESDNPYVINYTAANDTDKVPSANVIRIKVSRNLTLARDIIVKVRSKNRQYPKGFTRTIKVTPNKKTVLSQKAQPIGDAQTYTFEFDGLTVEQVIQKAQQLAREISQHERRLEIEMPGDTKINKDIVLKLQGTETDFDQIYFPAEIRHVIDINNGYRMNIAAKNHSPNSQVLI